MRDWKHDAMEYRDVDRAAQREAETRIRMMDAAEADGLPLAPVAHPRPLPRRQTRAAAAECEWLGSVMSRTVPDCHVGGLFYRASDGQARVLLVDCGDVYAESEWVPLARFERAGGLRVSASQFEPYWRIKGGE